MQPPPPYPVPPPYRPPPKPGLSPTAIALIVIGVVVAMGVLFIGIPLAAYFAVRMQQRAAGSASATVDPRHVKLTASYATPNGLVTAHYPEDFAAKKLDEATIIVVRNLPAGEDEVVTLAGVKTAITNDPREFGRILLGLVEKNVAAKGGTSTKQPARDTKCLDKYPGIEIEQSYTIPPGGTYVAWSCFFLRGDRGYEVRYDVPQARSMEETPLLERIVAATELAP